MLCQLAFGKRREPMPVIVGQNPENPPKEFVSFLQRPCEFSPLSAYSCVPDWRVDSGESTVRPFACKEKFMPPRPMSTRSRARKRSRVRSRTRKKDPIFVDGQRPRPMYVDYKDVELLKKMINRQGRIVGRRKSGCTAASQHAVSAAVKRARFMALLPYVGE
ncbi:MAG: 30S ribosomal protein S18 [Planctomycetota bacterium]|nr:30S ribosomal protein S18 [Planctomycetota bacterium]